MLVRDRSSRHAGAVPAQVDRVGRPAVGRQRRPPVGPDGRRVGSAVHQDHRSSASASGSRAETAIPTFTLPHTPQPIPRARPCTAAHGRPPGLRPDALLADRQAQAGLLQHPRRGRIPLGAPGGDLSRTDLSEAEVDDRAGGLGRIPTAPDRPGEHVADADLARSRVIAARPDADLTDHPFVGPEHDRQRTPASWPFLALKDRALKPGPGLRRSVWCVSMKRATSGSDR